MVKTADHKKPYMVFGLLMVIILPFILLWIAIQFPGYLRYGYIKNLIVWFWVLLIYLYANSIEKQDFLLWTGKKRSIPFYLASILIVLILSFLAGASQQLLPKLGLKVQTSPILKEMLAYLHTHTVLLVLTCVTAGVVEELIFRGYLIPRLNLLLKNSYLAVIISALLFGLAHIGYGTWVNMLVPFLLGLIFGAYYQKYRTLGVLIICHFTIDLVGLMFSK